MYQVVVKTRAADWVHKHGLETTTNPVLSADYAIAKAWALSVLSKNGKNRFGLFGGGGGVEFLGLRSEFSRQPNRLQTNIFLKQYPMEARHAISPPNVKRERNT